MTAWEDWRPIVTAGEMRAAEQRAIAAGATVEALMERAGAAAAEAIWRFVGPMPALVLCGPGNNGGDGHVIARLLRARGADVRVAALGELETARPAPLLIDALFGTGLTRALGEPVSQALGRLAEAASVRVAIDLPSGAAADDGRLLSPVPDYDLTVTFGALKPAHLLQPAARHMGRIVVADIGVDAASNLRLIGRPERAVPGPGDHKYSRGYVAVVAGEMPGAAALVASAAQRAGAGYVRLRSDEPVAGIPSAIVQGSSSQRGLSDPRIGAVAIGPGLGTGKSGATLLEAAFGSGHPLVLDADALTLIGADGLERLRGASATPILTPHAGEFARLFGKPEGGKVEQARQAAAKSGAVVLFKGADTVVAAPDGCAAIAPPAPHWLATAGTGDVLTGIVAAMRAGGLDAFEAACAGAWLHGRAAERAGPGLIADDLIDHLAECQ